MIPGALVRCAAPCYRREPRSETEGRTGNVSLTLFLFSAQYAQWLVTFLLRDTVPAFQQ